MAKTLMSDVFQILCKQDIWCVVWLKITSAEPIYSCGLLSVAENLMLDVCQTLCIAGPWSVASLLQTMVASNKLIYIYQVCSLAKMSPFDAFQRLCYFVRKISEVLPDPNLYRTLHFCSTFCGRHFNVRLFWEIWSKIFIQFYLSVLQSKLYSIVTCT